VCGGETREDPGMSSKTGKRCPGGSQDVFQAVQILPRLEDKVGLSEESKTVVGNTGHDWIIVFCRAKRKTKNKKKNTKLSISCLP